MIDHVSKIMMYGNFVGDYVYDRTLDGVEYHIIEFESDQSNKRYGFRVKMLMTADQLDKILLGRDYKVTGELVVSTKFSNFIIVPSEIVAVEELAEIDKYLSAVEMTVRIVKIIDSYKSRNLMICLGQFDSFVAKKQHVRMLCYARTGAFVNSVLIPDFEYVCNVTGYLNSFFSEDGQASTSLIVTKFTLDPEDETRTQKQGNGSSPKVKVAERDESEVTEGDADTTS